MSGGSCGSDGSGGFDGGLIGVSALIIQNNLMILKSSMIQREFQLDAWTLIIQKFTVIPPSSMVLLFSSFSRLCQFYHCCDCNYPHQNFHSFR